MNTELLFEAPVIAFMYESFGWPSNERHALPVLTA